MSDPNTPRDPQRGGGQGPEIGGGDFSGNSRYIIAGAVVVVLVLAVILFAGTGGDVDTTATDPMASPPATEEPATDPMVSEEQPADPEAAQAE